MNKLYFVLISLSLLQRPTFAMEKSKEENINQINENKKTEQIKLKHVNVKTLSSLFVGCISDYLDISCDEENNTITIEGEEKTVDLAANFIKEQIDVLPVQQTEILHVYDSGPEDADNPDKYL